MIVGYHLDTLRRPVTLQKPETMFARTRLAGLIASSSVLLGALLIPAGPALSLPPDTITGSAPATAHGPGTITVSYDIELTAAVDSASITTHQPTELPANTAGVTLDGVPVPAAQISRPDPRDITVQAGPLPTDGLAAGSHTLSFTVAVSAGPAASTVSSATLSFTRTAVPASISSADVPVALNQPDLAVALTPDSGEDQVGLLGTGRDLDLLVDVANLGYGTPASTLTINLPTGLALGSAGVSRDSTGDQLTCTPAAGNPQLIHCALGSTGHGGDPTLDIDLTSTAAAPIGQVATLTVSANPDSGQGSDQNPANNGVSARVQFTGLARLSYTVTPARTSVVLGGRTAVTLTIHNSGPQPAPSTLAFTVLIGSNFSIAGFTGRTGPPAQAVTVGSGGSGGTPTGSGAELLWFAGDIPVGGSVSAVLTVQAEALGAGKVGIAAFSGASDPNCPNFDCSPATVTIRAVSAPLVPDSTGPILAATGQASPATLWLSFGLLLAGFGMLILGRRPAYRIATPPRPGSHRRRAGGQKMVDRAAMACTINHSAR